LHALLQASPTLWEYQLFLYQSGTFHKGNINNDSASC
jgi:hypothetical protein